MPVNEFDVSSSPLAKAFLDGAASMGIKIGDLNGELENGAMLSQNNIWNGWRVSSFDAYLDPILELADIHLLANTLTVKVIIENRKAVGVYTANLYSGKTSRIDATKEVILSAGVIGSPQLLMLSGLGPREHLEQLQIPVVANLPGVGKNLRDHLNVPMYFHLDAPISTTTTKVRSPANVWKFFTKGEGHLAHSGVEVVVRLPVPGYASTPSKMYFMLFNLGAVHEGVFTTIANFKKDAFHETFPDAKNDSKEGFILLSTCSHPISRGSITLESKNPITPPLIDPNYLNETEDVKCLIKAIKLGARLGATKPLREFGARLHVPGYSKCVKFNQSLEDDRFLECWLKTSAITAYHPIGTCSMGPDDDPMSVLDWKMRVRGIKNLRVVDSSAFPHPVSGNPHAAVLMLAEKAVDFILEQDNRKQKQNIRFDSQ